jgi:7,8-dihydropterin-6-yl-methyl-4-(beta-D-ribofuranosyl)aminobenzene 5'-phosphate synthase
MSHPDADVNVVQEARVIGPGVAVLPPLPRMLFWLGPSDR